ncbi:MAG: copper homeostasis protein CutC [Alphaproteobacteria bacterium]
MPAILEICVDSADGLAAAIAGGADRIELCAALAVGGLTPPSSLIALARQAPVPVRMMIRPRDGNFRWTAAEVSQMQADVAEARVAGLEGVVVGASLADGSLDTACLAELLAARGALGATLHRAFDLVPDPHAALDQAAALGCDHILTSGQEVSVVDGAGLVADLVGRAAGRLVVMPGGGLAPDSIASLIRRTGARAVHASAAVAGPPPSGKEADFGFVAPEGRMLTDAATVRALKQAVVAAG